MKKVLIIVSIAGAGLITACGGPERSPGRAYMPDMAYSRAVETYSELDSSAFTRDAKDLGEGKIYYTAMPVPGTMARGDMPYHYMTNDSAGYAAAASIKNPLPVPDSMQMIEADRLYQINCGICHGSKLDGQGPLYVSGVYAAAPRNFMEPAMKEMTEGTMYHAVTYGKGQMGSYASQLNPRQRWMVIHYVKAKQAGGAAPAGAGADTTARKDTLVN